MPERLLHVGQRKNGSCLRHLATIRSARCCTQPVSRDTRIRSRHPACAPSTSRCPTVQACFVSRSPDPTHTSCRSEIVESFVHDTVEFHTHEVHEWQACKTSYSAPWSCVITLAKDWQRIRYGELRNEVSWFQRLRSRRGVSFVPVWHCGNGLVSTWSR